MRPLPLLLLCACTGKGVVVLTPTETGETGETGVGSTDDSLCGRFSGLEVEGRTLVYDGSTEEVTRTLTVTVDDLDTVGQTASTTEHVEVLSVAGAATTTSTLSWVCDADGLALGTRSSATTSVVDGQKFDEWSITTYDPPALLVARDLEEGTVWSGSSTVRMEGNLIDSTSVAISWTSTVIGTEELNVAAGRFTSLKIDTTGEFSGTRWLAAGVGLVQDATDELVSVSD